MAFLFESQEQAVKKEEEEAQVVTPEPVAQDENELVQVSPEEQVKFDSFGAGAVPENTADYMRYFDYALNQEFEQEEQGSVAMGTVAQMGTEIPSLIATNVYLAKKFRTFDRMRLTFRALRAGNYARYASRSNPAVFTPKGFLGMLAIEGTVGATTNLLGQSARNLFGVDTGFSVGENLASVVFNTTVVTGTGQKILRLGDGVVTSGLWKGFKYQTPTLSAGKEALRQNVIDGAAFGLAETAVRQEFEILLGDRESRSALEYVLAPFIGAGAGGGLGHLSRTRQGRIITSKLFGDASQRLATSMQVNRERITQLESELSIIQDNINKSAELIKARKDSADTIKSWHRARDKFKKKNAQLLKLKDERNSIEMALFIVRDANEKIDAQHSRIDEAESAPINEEAKSEADFIKPDPQEAPSTNRDAEYERLVKEDPEAAKQMLREEAEANGYDTEAFHGTHSEGIKEFAGGTHFGSKGAASKRNADVRKNIEYERDNILSSLSKQKPNISKYFDVESDADVKALYQKYRDKYIELDTDGRGFGGESVDSKPVPQELIAIQNETDALILQKLKEGLKKQKDDLEIERQKALEGSNTPKLKAKVNEVYDDLVKRDTEVSESLILSYEEGVNSLTRGSTVMPVFIKTGNVKRTVDVEGVDEMGNPIEGGSRSITDDFEEGVNTLQYTNKFEGDESFVIKDSEQAKSGELIATDKDGNVIPLSQRFKGQEAPATPKDTPEATPAPLQDAETGKPITIKGYHGTKTKFDSFDPSATAEDKPFSFGSHFTTSKSEAEVYATSVKRAADTKKGKPIKMEGDENVIEADITLENPLVIKTDMTTASMYADVNRANILKTIEDAKAKGIEYDGVIIQRRKGNGEGDHDNIIIFDNTKAKRTEAPEATPAPETPKLETNLKPKKVLSAFETGGFPVQSVVVNGETKYITSFTIEGLGRKYYFTDEKGFSQFDIDGNDISKLLTVDQPLFDTRKDLLNALQKKVDEAPAPPKDAPEPKEQVSTSDRIDALTSRFDEQLPEGSNPEPSQRPEVQIPTILKESTDIYEEQYQLFTALWQRVDELNESGEAFNEKELVAALENIRNLVKLNDAIRDRGKKIFGRSGKALQRAENRAGINEDMPSVTARELKEKRSWMELESELQRLLDEGGQANTDLDVPLVRPERAKKQTELADEIDDFADGKPPKEEVVEEPTVKEDEEIVVPDEGTPTPEGKPTKPTKPKPKKPLTPEEEAEKIATKLQKQKEKLQEELDKKQKEFTGQQDKDPKKTKPKQKDPEIEDLKQRIRWYENAEKEVATIADLKAKLARLAAIEGEGVVSQLKDTTDPKPKAPTDSSPEIKELTQKIAESKARMRQKLKDIDKAQESVDNKTVQKKYRYDQLLLKLRNNHYASMDADIAGSLTKTVRFGRQASLVALVSQPATALLAIPAGVHMFAKQGVRPLTAFVGRIVADRSLTEAQKAAKFEFAAFMHGFTDRDGLGRAFFRTLRYGRNATDGDAGKMENVGRLDQLDPSREMIFRTGVEGRMERAANRAARRERGNENVIDFFKNAGGATVDYGGNAYTSLARLIGAMDQLFYRQGSKMSTKSSSMYLAHQKLKDEGQEGNFELFQQYADELYQSNWKDDDGLSVLNIQEDFAAKHNFIRRELFYALDTENIDPILTSTMGEIEKLMRNIKNRDTADAVALEFLTPYTVPLRAFGRNVQTTPLGLLQFPLRMNPHNKVVKTLEKNIADINEEMSDPFWKDSPDELAQMTKEKRGYEERLNRARYNRYLWNEETFHDAVMGSLYYTLGVVAGREGIAYGSLIGLSEERKKELMADGHYKFTLTGVAMDYFTPAGGSFMFGATQGNYEKALEEGAIDQETNQLSMVISTVKGMGEINPLAISTDTLKNLTSDDSERREQGINSLIQRYDLNPMVVRKIVKQINSDGTVGDLRGGTFDERYAYQIFGMGAKNKKVNILGEDAQDVRNQWSWVSKFLSRKTVDQNVLNELEKIDVVDAIPQRIPETVLNEDIKLVEFRNRDGLHAEYRLMAKQLRIYKDPTTGRTLQQQLKKTLAKDGDALALINEGITYVDGKPRNEGLSMVGADFNSYYTQIRDWIVNSPEGQRASKQYINKNEETLYDVIQAALNKQGEPIVPISEVLTGEKVNIKQIDKIIPDLAKP